MPPAPLTITCIGRRYSTRPRRPLGGYRAEARLRVDARDRVPARERPVLRGRPVLREPVPLRDRVVPRGREVRARERVPARDVRLRPVVRVVRRELVPPVVRRLVVRRVVDGRRAVERRRPPFRSAGGISACTTALVSCGIRRSRKLDMRSSWRRIERARRAVSRSPTLSASASMAV
jgi:hypothetical protein